MAEHTNETTIANLREALRLVTLERDRAVAQCSVYEQAMRNITAAVFASIPKDTGKRIVSILAEASQ